MPKLNPISSRKLIKILTKLGFELVRVRESHHFFQNKKTNLVTTVPVHGNEDVRVGLLSDILDDINLSIEEYNKLR